MRTTLVITMATTLLTLARGPLAAAPSSLKSPVVVELFTSQGCSSCPPADALLIRLAQDPNVIPLSFHVDYWNHLGWSDPFSSAAFSQRQQRYAGKLGSNVYTPQAVINGSTELVGSDETRARRVINGSGARSAGASIKLSRVGGKVVADVSVTERVAGRLQLVFVTYQRSVTTPVARGENGGRNLRNDFVVRRLSVVDEFPGEPGAHHAETTPQIDAAWSRGPFGMVAFLQDPRSLKIYGAATINL